MQDTVLYCPICSKAIVIKNFYAEKHVHHEVAGIVCSDTCHDRADEIFDSFKAA